MKLPVLAACVATMAAAGCVYHYETVRERKPQQAADRAAEAPRAWQSAELAAAPVMQK
jgi:hypothetical protein